MESFNSTKTQDFYSALGYAYIHISLKKKNNHHSQLLTMPTIILSFILNLFLKKIKKLQSLVRSFRLLPSLQGDDDDAGNIWFVYVIFDLKITFAC